MLLSRKAVNHNDKSRSSKTELLIIFRPYVILSPPLTPTSIQSNACIWFLTFQQIEFAEGFVCGLIVSEEFLSNHLWSNLSCSMSRKIRFVSKQCAHQLKGKRRGVEALRYSLINLFKFKSLHKWIDNKQQHFTHQLFVHNAKALITANKQTIHNETCYQLLACGAWQAENIDWRWGTERHLRLHDCRLWVVKFTSSYTVNSYHFCWTRDTFFEPVITISIGLLKLLQAVTLTA